MTVGAAFGEIRAKRGFTMLEVATRSGLAESTISKVECSDPVRWETIHLAISVGLNVQPGCESYQAMHLLWLKQRAELAESRSPTLGTKNLTKHAVEASRKFRNLIRDLTPEQTKKVLAAAQRSARSL